jgi:hypothetical protein
MDCKHSGAIKTVTEEVIDNLKTIVYSIKRCVTCNKQLNIECISVFVNISRMCICGNAEATIVHGTKGNCCVDCARE